jgi:hypothetical protein
MKTIVLLSSFCFLVAAAALWYRDPTPPEQSTAKLLPTEQYFGNHPNIPAAPPSSVDRFFQRVQTPAATPYIQRTDPTKRPLPNSKIEDGDGVGGSLYPIRPQAERP